MTNATYIQHGEALDYTNGTDVEIPAGAVVTIGDRIGVAAGPIAPGGIGVLHMSGVFEIAKTGSAAIEMGKAVYFDGTGVTSEAAAAKSGEAKPVPAGYAAAPAAADAATVLVKLAG